MSEDGAVKPMAPAPCKSAVRSLPLDRPASSGAVKGEATISADRIGFKLAAAILQGCRSNRPDEKGVQERGGGHLAHLEKHGTLVLKDNISQCSYILR
jgi:hypothetical protein